MLKVFLKKHFSLKQLYPLHESPVLFTVTQWQLNKSQPNLIYLIYRTAVFIFFLTIWSLRVSVLDSAIHLTMWGYSACTLQVLLAFMLQFSTVLFDRIYKKPDILKKILNLYPVYWVVQSSATSVGFMITIVYWSALYKDQVFDAMNFFLHGSNSILLMVDLWIVGHPVRILHFVYPLLFGTTYTVFGIIYHFFDINRGGLGYVYPIQNWGKPKKAIPVALGIGVLIICLHFLTFGIYKLKLIIYERIYSVDETKTENSEGLP